MRFRCKDFAAISTLPFARMRASRRTSCPGIGGCRRLERIASRVSVSSVSAIGAYIISGERRAGAVEDTQRPQLRFMPSSPVNSSNVYGFGF